MLGPTGKPAIDDQQAILNRRQFLTKLCLGLSGVGAAIVGVPVVGFLLAPLLRKVPEQWQAVGAIEEDHAWRDYGTGEAKPLR